MRPLSLLLHACLTLSFLTSSALAAPKKLLVVSITTGFRHSSIETGEKVLAELASKNGAFTIDFVQQPEPAPKNPPQPKRSPQDTDESFQAKQNAYAAAMADFLPQRKAWEDKITEYCKDKLAIDNIKHYDGFIFCNTTGELPFPDPQGFINLIKNGKAFIAMHSGSDTFHKFRPYIDMLGGEFQSHKAQVEVQPVFHDKAHPATSSFPNGYKIFDEIYIFKSFDPATVHGLVGLNAHPNDNTPGYYPISWNKLFGKGKVFYTSLGHREDVWDPTWKTDSNERKNAPKIAQAYQDHILGGILWALDLKPGDATVGNIK